MTKHIATFAGGCFWCIDAAFRRVNGVLEVRSGYMGGQLDNPSYKQICTGTTGHAEVVQITYEPSVIEYSTLLAMFFTLHDPTQLNRQGNDFGTQYRSAIFYHDQAQHTLAKTTIEQIQSDFEQVIVTELTPTTVFYSAEDYHQDYYTNNPNQGYCSVLIAPKIVKFEQQFQSLLK